jgi:hypothetical protein
MTFEELAAAGLSPNKEEIHESENIHVQESDSGIVAAPDSEVREEGEVRSKEKILEMLMLTQGILFLRDG